MDADNTGKNKRICCELFICKRSGFWLNTQGWEDLDISTCAKPRRDNPDYSFGWKKQHSADMFFCNWPKRKTRSMSHWKNDVQKQKKQRPNFHYRRCVWQNWRPPFCFNTEGNFRKRSPFTFSKAFGCPALHASFSLVVVRCATIFNAFSRRVCQILSIYFIVLSVK